MEGFQVLQYSGPLVSTLYKITSSLGGGERAQHRLSLCKYLYRASTFASHHPHPEADLQGLFLRVLEDACTGTRRELCDVECLVREVLVSANKHQVANSRYRPWAGVVEDVVEVVNRLLNEIETEDFSISSLPPFLRILLDSIEGSETVASQLLPALHASVLQNNKVNSFLKLVSR